MMNKNLFEIYTGVRAPNTDTKNSAGGIAYSRSPKGALAQYCLTGCLGNTYYVEAKTQLKTVLELCDKVDNEFIKQCALYSRQKGFLKDIPALLVAILAVRKAEGWQDVFFKVINNGKMLRNFITLIRPGKNAKGEKLGSPINGKASLGSSIKKAIQKWLNTANENRLLNALVGNTPTLKDIIRMAHPKGDEAHDAFYAWVLDKPLKQRPGEMAIVFQAFPNIHKFEIFKAILDSDVPLIYKNRGEPDRELDRKTWLADLESNIPFQLLTGLKLNDDDWAVIAKKASWQQTRMNLNTFHRHGVFKDKANIERVAKRLQDKAAIEKGNVYPYQLLTAYQNTRDVPLEITNALQIALEKATENVPFIPGGIIVIVDVSGSMSNPITGRRGVSSTTRCVDVAALIASCILRKNQRTIIVPVDTEVHQCRLNPLDSIVTNATILSRFGGGGTDLSKAMKEIARNPATVANLDLIVVISDNESWMDTKPNYYGNASASMQYWNLIHEFNKKTKLVCIDLTPNTTTQFTDTPNVFNIGGFSDNVFDLIASIAKGEATQDMFVKAIESYNIHPGLNIGMSSINDQQ